MCILGVIVLDVVFYSNLKLVHESFSGESPYGRDRHV